MPAEDDQDNRKDPRAQTDATVKFTINDVIFLARLVNLSREGCMIEGPCAIATAGRAITVTLVTGYSVPGEIVWKNRDRIGVSFHEQLVDATLNYFQLHLLRHSEDEPLADRFGRDMPPMRSRHDLG